MSEAVYEEPYLQPEQESMWNFIMYCLAVVVGYVLVWFFEPKEKVVSSSEMNGVHTRSRRQSDSRFQLSSVFAALGLNRNEFALFEAFQDQFTTFEEVGEACKQAGLEKSNLIIGVDFTASNEWQGRKTFSQNCLHRVSGNKIYNPYQKVISILGQTLLPFDEDNLIPTYGFGDSVTTGKDVFCFKEDDAPCQGFLEVLDKYNEVAKRVVLGGPTNFAPVIHKAIEMTMLTQGYHILVIIADGQVTEESQTIEAIVHASHFPLSIIVVGVGDGPWDIMTEFDRRLPKRKYDNFRFVNYHKVTNKAKNPDAAFALQALMEIPDQYKKIKELGYLPEEQCSDDDGTCGMNEYSATYANSRSVTV